MKNRYCLSASSMNLYCSDDLSPEEMQAAEQHLTNCPECRREIAAINAMLSALPRINLTLSEAEKARFSDRVTSVALKTKSSNKLQVWGAAATTLAAALLAVMIFNPDNLSVITTQPAPAHMAELDLVEHLDLLENMELLEIMELLEDSG